MPEAVLQPLFLTASSDLHPLLDQSLIEGYDFLQILWDEYESGKNRFDAMGARLLQAHIHDQLIAVGGVHPDPYVQQRGIGRIRHLYVLPAYRRTGVGRQVMAGLLDHARAHFDVVTLHTMTLHGDRFYRAIGFTTEPRFRDATHWLTLNPMDAFAKDNHALYPHA